VTKRSNVYRRQTSAAENLGAGIERSTGGEDIVHKNIAKIGLYPCLIGQGKGILQVGFALFSVESGLGWRIYHALYQRFDNDIAHHGGKRIGQQLRLIEPAFTLLARM